jgi:hypothetical protein
MPCLCGDLYCHSCGSAQGNFKCANCGAWSADGGCADPETCNKALSDSAEAEALYYQEMERGNEV